MAERAAVNYRLARQSVRDRLFASLGNRAALVAVILWLLYLVAERPWHGSSCLYDMIPNPSVPFIYQLQVIPASFAKIGAMVATACGFYPCDFGAIQFLSGLVALVLTVKLPFWIFERRRPDSDA